MPAASDASPIISLAAIDRLDILENQFGEKLIPPAVVNELKIGTAFRGVKAIQQALSSGWVAHGSYPE
jgi:predicted nucleic acid-binding protein